MGTCKECRWSSEFAHRHNFLNCHHRLLNPMITCTVPEGKEQFEVDWKYMPKNSLIQVCRLGHESELHNVSFLVGPEFGCVHWEAKR